MARRHHCLVSYSVSYIFQFFSLRGGDSNRAPGSHVFFRPAAFEFAPEQPLGQFSFFPGSVVCFFFFLWKRFFVTAVFGSQLAPLLGQ